MKRALIVLSLLLLSGCASLAPEYVRPAAPVPERWDNANDTLDPEVEAYMVAWQDFFTDPRLRSLIDQALDHNRELRVAILDIERARALYRVRRADLFPGVDATVSQNAQRVPGDLSQSGDATINRQYSAGIGFAAYELDFFGRVRSLNEQALQEFLATREARRSAQISLVAEVAQIWLSLAADLERLDLAQRTLEAQRESFGLTERSFDLGAASALDLNQARTSVDRARADVARFTTRANQGRNALALVVGTPEAQDVLPVELEDAARTLVELPAGLPSEVLQRRPDILAAELRLRGANANIGAARAAMFPRIALTASAGSASASLSDLFSAGSGTWSFIPRIDLPIFDAGQRAANVQVARMDREIALARYERAIQDAFREVADVLAERETLDEQLDAQRSLVEATSETFRLSNARYRSGVDSYLGVLDAQRTLYAAQQELIDVRLSDASSLVTLYRVLGGGWQ